MMLHNCPRSVLRRTLALSMLFSFAAGCGAVGSPIAPEDIGIEAKIRAQRQAEEKRSTPEEPEVVLPPLRPVGTQ